MCMNWTPNDDIDDSGVIARARATEYYLFLVELTFAPHNIRFRDNSETKNCPRTGELLTLLDWMRPAMVLTWPGNGNEGPLE
jgi:hypothetical protein